MITLSNVSFEYPVGFGIKNISFTLDRGEFISIVGPNGAGKTTLLKLAAGQLTPKKGSIKIKERDLSQMKAREIAKEIAYLSQTGLKTDLTVEDVILHGRFPHTPFPHVYGKRERNMAESAMKRMGLLPLAHRPLSSLSGGERQKAMIAMALCQNSGALLLDEPTAFLDPSHRLSLMEELGSLITGGKSILCVLHDLPLALRYSHRVGVMQAGKLVSLETPEQTVKSGILTEIFGIELGKSEDGFYYYGNRKNDTD